MSDSIWKKEISLGRKPKAEAPADAAAAPVEAEPAKQSLLKKEISFGRKAKEAKAEAPQAVLPPVSPAAPKQSFLKKEISFGRKAKEPMPEAPQAVLPPVSPAAPKQSFLKKEISFGRKKQDREVERLVHEAAQAVSPVYAPADTPPAEVAPTALAEAAVAAMVQAGVAAEVQASEPVVEPEAVAAAPAFVEHAPVEATFVEHPHVDPLPIEQSPVEPAAAAPGPVVPEPVTLAAIPDPGPVELHAVSPAPAAAPEADVFTVPVLPVDEAPVPLPPVLPPAVPAPPLPPAIAGVSGSLPEPPAAPAPLEPEPAAWSEPLAAAPQAPVESWVAEPVLPPEPELAAEPELAPAVVVHPPVPAAALPPLPEAGPTTPFWKKELSFSRKPKAEQPPKPEKAPKPAGSTPFWKKEIGRKKSQAAVEAEPVALDEPTGVLPTAPAAPFWKKQLSLSMPSLSSLPSGKGGHGAKRLVGLKVGSSQIAAARVSNNGVVEVQQLAREALAPGVVVGGELRDPDALGEALKSFFARNKLPKKGVRLGIASNRIGVRIFDIVGVTEEKQLANAIQFRAQEALPIPLDEAVLDYRVLDESTDEEGQVVKRVLLVVVYRELVERYVAACRKAGIALAGIDLEAFALLRSMAPPEDRGSSALVAVSIGYDRSTFAVSDGRVCEFTRVLEWGGSALNVALARIFDSTPSEVEAIKRGLSLDGTAIPPGLTEEQAAQALDVIRRQVQSFARELVSSLQFYQNQPGSLGIGEIVLTGGTTHLHGLAEELERLIGVHVRVGDPFNRVKVSKKLAATDQVGSLAVAIGLGIED